MTRVPGRVVRRRLAALDPRRDHVEVARASLVTLHGHPTVVHALFTVAFLEQVAVPAMARTLNRRGTGDIVVDTLQRTDDTIVFFGQLLDHGPDSPTGRAWIERLTQIHARFPIRDADSLFTLATLALDPHDLTQALGASPFGEAEQEAHWWFWRAVAEAQGIPDLPTDRHALRAWASAYARDEFAATEDGRHVAAALVDAFGRRCLPRPLRPLAPRVVSALCSPQLRRVHDLPEPGAVVSWGLRLLLRAYARTVDVRRVPLDRSLAVDFGDRRHGIREPAEVGHRARAGAPGPASTGEESTSRDLPAASWAGP
ncbi:hypothetical protein GCM10027596_38430 [Nocardioides korecus]